MSHHDQPMFAIPPIPIVVQIGFAGARFLFDPDLHPRIDTKRFEAGLTDRLTELLRQLPKELGLSEQHFCCGVSSLAIGSDMAFTRALRILDWPHRVLLPQPRSDFLEAVGTDGTPDFTSEQATEATELLESQHVIQEHLVSDSDDRHTRFADVNRELVRISDLIICVQRSDSSAKAAGTQEVVELTEQRKRAAMILTVHVGASGEPVLEWKWNSHRSEFSVPSVPQELQFMDGKLEGIPTVADYCQQLKSFSSQQSLQKQNFFKLSAFIIVATHVVATLFAVFALKLKGGALINVILAVELLLLLCGFATHWLLHHGHAARLWAMARLVAEIARSSTSLVGVPGYLSHLFVLPIPPSLRPLLRTLNVLHLRETRRLDPADWEQRRTDYVRNRLTKQRSGQIDYYGGKLKAAAKWHHVASVAFYLGSIGAIGATLLKLLLYCNCLPIAEAYKSTTSAWLGGLAVLLPVVAVAALSLAASFDVEARHHTFADMLQHLKRQHEFLELAQSEREFARLALETESALVGETVAWYSRRAFTSVS